MFDVAACGFAGAMLTQHASARRIVELPAPHDPSFLLAGVSQLNDGSTTDLALVHDGSRLAAHRVAALRALLLHRTTLSVGMISPYTGLVAAATYLSSLAEAGVPMGPALGFVRDQREGLMPSFAVTASVTGIDLPPVRLSHHVRSWLPGTTFTFVFGDRIELSNEQRAPQLMEGSVDTITCGDPRLAPGLAAAMHGEHVDLTPPPGGAPLWGRARFFEVTYVRRDLSAALTEVQAVSRCPYCGTSTYSTCPRCLPSEGIPA